MRLIHNIVGHFTTITRHKYEVFKNCARCGIPIQGLLHDMSKYSPTEFFESVINYQEGKRSPNESARETKGYSAAWIHHMGRNKHHFEYWKDYATDGDRKLTPVKMPINYVVEMFCDRVAASKIYNGLAYKDTDPIDYFKKGKKRRQIHPETERLLMYLLTKLAEKGEKETFAYIRKNIFKYKVYRLKRLLKNSFNRNAD